MPARFAMLGLFRGSQRMLTSKARHRDNIGACGDHGDLGDARRWETKSTLDHGDIPLVMVPWLNLGPLIVKRAAFEGLGGFNTSYSQPGNLGIGFDNEFTARVWVSGRMAALACPSALTAFRNGCGGKGTTANMRQRVKRWRRAKQNEDAFSKEYLSRSARIEAQAAAAQGLLSANSTLVRSLRLLFPGCISCSTARWDAAAQDEFFGPVPTECLRVTARPGSICSGR